MKRLTFRPFFCFHLISATYPDRVYRVDVAQVLNMFTLSVYPGLILCRVSEFCTLVSDRSVFFLVFQEKIYNVVDILEDGIFIVDLKDDSIK